MQINKTFAVFTKSRSVAFSTHSKLHSFVQSRFNSRLTSRNPVPRNKVNTRLSLLIRNQPHYNSIPPPVIAAFIMSSSLELSESVREVKEKYSSMELEKKRALYKCGKKFVDLEKILTWEEYYGSNKIAPFKGDSTYEVNKTLNSKVSLWQGDITVLEIDAIVNAANSSLLGGGGVDGAIHRAAGGDLLEECRELKGCPAGQAKITGGYRLPAKNVIHTVGPQGERPDVLISCYVNSLELMRENELRTIAFPCIATGIYGYPRVKAANIALTTVREFLEKHHEKVDRIIFTVFLEEDKEAYEDFMQKYFPLE